MIAPRILSLVVALVLTAQAGLFAQQEPPVVSGDRVRIAAPTVDPEDWLVGTLVETAADTCVLAVDNQADTLALPFASVTRFEVNRGRRSHWVTGAALGAVVGGAGGALLGYMSCIYEPKESDCVQTHVTVGAVVGGTVLGLVGAGIGSAIKTDRWEEVPLDQLRVGLVRRRNGRLGLAVSVSFRP